MNMCLSISMGSPRLCRLIDEQGSSTTSNHMLALPVSLLTFSGLPRRLTTSSSSGAIVQARSCWQSFRTCWAGSRSPQCCCTGTCGAGTWPATRRAGRSCWTPPATVSPQRRFLYIATLCKRGGILRGFTACSQRPYENL